MAITAGSQINAADFINTSAGAADASKGVKLDAAGKINPNMTKRFGVRLTGTTDTISHSGLGTMSWPTEDYDDDSMHEGVTNPSRITFNTAGYWIFGAGFAFGGVVSSGPIGVVILLNGTTVIAGGGGALWGGAAGACGVRHFAAGDYIQVQTISPSSSVGAGSESNFWAQMISKD